MRDKYYTPEIEEFHVGFEYEAVTLNIEKQVNEYKKFNVPFVPDTLKFMLESDFKPRVKYLDREDIESLGFVKRNPENNNKSSDHFKMKAPGEIAYWTEIDLDFRWGFKDVSIRGVRGNEGDYLFRGTIKNKSELKRLLKQLGV